MVLFFTLGVTALTTLLCGLAPALHAVGRDVQPMLTGSGKGSGGEFRHGRFRAGLVVVEVALSMNGRWLSQSEVDAMQPVAVINQTMAAHFFGSENPMGRQIEAKGFDEKLQPARDVHFQVIGVVRDIKDYGPQVPVIPMAAA